jgi:hypothetical protein
MPKAKRPGHKVFIFCALFTTYTLIEQVCRASRVDVANACCQEYDIRGFRVA